MGDVLAFRVADRKLRPSEKPLPKLRPGWALVRVRFAGICNTDVEILRGYHAFRGTPGHEFVGEVADVRGVSGALKKKWLGRRVVGEINVSCSAYAYRPVCAFCRRGLKTHCARRTVLGIVSHDGAFAEYLALPLENLHALPDSISDEQAVFVEPLAAACEILEQVNPKQFQEAAVLGDGKLAQLIALVLRTAVPRVVMYGKHEKKLALARRAGIKTQKVRGDALDLQNVKESYGLLVEATGSPSGIRTRTTHDRATRHTRSEIHVSRRSSDRNMAHRGQGTEHRRLALRSVHQGNRSVAFRHSGSDAPHHAHVRSERSARSDWFRSETRCDESLVESLIAGPLIQMILQTVDARSDAGGAEAIINVHDGYVGCARIEHAEQRGHAAETCAITDAGWHRNHGSRN